MKAPPRADIQRVLGQRSLKKFTEFAWSLVEPSRPLKWNWHIDALYEHLKAVLDCEIRDLVINVPPGTMKSLACSVFWPTWSWIHQPELKWITASYSAKVVRRDAIRSRKVIETPWWAERWGDRFQPDEEFWTNDLFKNNKGGFRYATTVGGAVTGEHADIHVVDDPIKPLDAPGSRVDSAALSTCLLWWSETMASRFVDVKTSRRVIIMQRLHERDLAGHMLKDMGYEHLCLPMEAERRCVVSVPHNCSMSEDARGNEIPPTTVGFKDTREKNELLWPDRYPGPEVKKQKRSLGSRGTAAQLQQRPTPAGGSIFKREWIKYWKAFPRGNTQCILSWDCAFKGLDDSDWVVGQVWIRKGGEFFLVDQVRDKMAVGATCRALLAQGAKWPKAVRKLIEDKANGPAVIELLKKKVPGLLPVNPRGGKVARANAVEALWEAGNVYIPDPSIAPWVNDFEVELVNFNGDPNREDDQVDGMTQALSYLHDRTTETYKAAMRNF